MGNQIQEYIENYEAKYRIKSDNMRVKRNSESEESYVEVGMKENHKEEQSLKSRS